MSFQKVVNRNFTTGFVGDIVRDGPLRAVTCRFAPLTGGALSSARNDGNVIGRVFGFVGEVPVSGQTLAALVPTVALGAVPYAGVLIHSKHYALQGNSVDGTLGASMTLPNGSEGEIADMAIPVAQIYNHTTGALAIQAGWALGYVPNTVDVADEPLGLPFGALVAFNPVSPPPIWLEQIPGAKVKNAITLSASAVGALVAGTTIIQLTV